MAKVLERGAELGHGHLVALADVHTTEENYEATQLCGLTFELRGRNRDGAWPARRMMTASASRAKCHAGGGPAPAKG